MCYQMLNPAGYMKKSVSYTAGKYTCIPRVHKRSEDFTASFSAYAYLIKYLPTPTAQGITIEDLECSLEVMLARPHLNSDTAVWR